MKIVHFRLADDPTIRFGAMADARHLIDGTDLLGDPDPRRFDLGVNDRFSLDRTVLDRLRDRLAEPASRSLRTDSVTLLAPVPMPGKVIAVDVAAGDTVTAGQRLMVLEAMKMEHAMTAPFDGTVTELNASEGGQVQVEAVLAVVEPEA